MVQLNPKSAKDTYDKQKEMSEFPKAVSGTFLVVNKHLQKKTLQSGTQILTVKPTVLKVLEVDDSDKAAAEALVGKPLWPGIEIWCTWDKAFNVAQVNHLALAHGYEDGYDPDSEEDLAKAIANGRVYKLTIRVEKDERTVGDEKKTFTKIRMVEAKDVDQNKAKVFTSAPSFPWKRDKVWQAEDSKKGGARRTESPMPDDVPFDDDVPF